MWWFKKPIQAWRPTMSHRNQGAVARQVESLQRQFAEAPGLPFAELLSPELIKKLFKNHEADFRERDYPPLITLAMFLSQCHDADQSLRQAVARLIAHRVAQGEAQSSSNTGAYCKSPSASSGKGSKRG